MEASMAGQPFRFLHAGDFHLEQPLFGLAEVPQQLRDLFVDAPYLAAERVFEAAIREKVDFVVLTGDLLDVERAGARGLTFLLEHFERLDAQGIAVYWAGGLIDGPQEWPAAAALPGGVLVFPAFKSEQFTHFRGENPVATLWGRSCTGSMNVPAADFGEDNDRLFTVAITHGQCAAERLVARPIEYWALGGEHNRQTLGSALRTIHYPGSPQGRSAEEPGPHGCTLVHVNEEQKGRLQFIPTDAARWQVESLTLLADASKAELRKHFTDRIKQLRTDGEERALLVKWIVRGGRKLLATHHRAQLTTELLDWLRGEFGVGRLPLWTLDIEFDDAEVPAEHYSEDSMLGEFLRAVRALQLDDQAEIELASLLSPRQQESPLAALADCSDPEVRQQVLCEAATLGARLLGADDR
jgi:DNA repair exonuclease SbcCD nuclease subunit